MKSKSEGEIAKAKAESLAAELEKQRKTAESINKNNMLYNRCLNEYINLMHGSNLNDTGFIESEKLNKIHENAAQSALKQVNNTNKSVQKCFFFKFRNKKLYGFQ